MRIERLGETAVVLSAGGAVLETQRRIWRLASAARDWPGVEDTVIGMRNLTLILDAPSRVAEAQTRLIEEWEAGVLHAYTSAVIEIPVSYGGDDGPDLSAVATACGCSETDVVTLHAAREYVAYFLGFQPGFAYLGEIDERLRLPRRHEPRPRVPAGSVAIAERMTGIYPTQSPGGWHLIGKTAVCIFDVRRSPPSLIHPGDRVRFVAVVDT